MKKLLSLLLSAAMVVSLMSAATPSASAASNAPKAVVTQLTVGKNTAYLYVPESELTVCSSATAPCFIVFGDKTYTAKTAEAEAVASGLAQLAAQEGATVTFVNPQGSTWDSGDAEAFLTLQDLYTDSSNNTYVDGMTEDGNIIGAVESRVYIYANGTGADFAAANYMKYMSVEQMKGNGDVIPVDRTAVGINLFNPSTLPEIQEKADIAVAVINGPKDAAEKLAKLTDKAIVTTSSEKDGFDAKWIKANYDSFSGAYRRQANITLPIHNYDAEGIVRSIESQTLADGSVIHYVVFYSKELNVQKNAASVPLVLLFHGGGNTALGVAQTSEWPEIAKANGFIVVSVDKHTSDASPDQVAELLDHLKDKLPIDASRVYASGFSMGGVKSWGMFDLHPELLAGIAPLGAVSEPEGDTDAIVPVFYVGGQSSPLAEMASQNLEKATARYKDVFRSNQIARTYRYDKAENLYWGMNGDITYQVTDRTAFKNSTLNVNLYQSTDGKYYTAFGDATNQSHEVYARNCWAAWDFLSQFSRNADGTLSIREVSYVLPADDGHVTGNSYNLVAAYGDVAPNASYAEAVRLTTAAGIFTGVGGNKFDPSGKVTRAQVVTALGRLAGAKQAVGSFSDVATDAWYAGYAGWAVKNEITSADENGRFRPDEQVSGDELNAMLRSYAELANVTAVDSVAGASVTRADFAQQLAGFLGKN